jgi:hypothetical protein
MGTAFAHVAGVGVGLSGWPRIVIEGWLTAVVLGVPLIAAIAVLSNRRIVVAVNATIAAIWGLVLLTAGVSDAAVTHRWWIAILIGIVAVELGAFAEGRYSTPRVRRPTRADLTLGMLGPLEQVAWKWGLAFGALVVFGAASIPVGLIGDTGRDWVFLRQQADDFRLPPGMHEAERVETGTSFCLGCPGPGNDPKITIYVQFDGDGAEAQAQLVSAVAEQLGSIGTSCGVQCARIRWRHRYLPLSRTRPGYVVVGHGSKCRHENLQTGAAAYLWIDFNFASSWDVGRPYETTGGYCNLDDSPVQSLEPRDSPS